MNLLNFEYLTVVNESLESWCEKYRIEPIESKCLFCENVLKTTTPAFGKGWRGLVAEACISCGKNSNFSHFVLTPGADVPALFKVMA